MYLSFICGLYSLSCLRNLSSASLIYSSILFSKLFKDWLSVFRSCFCLEFIFLCMMWGRDHLSFCFIKLLVLILLRYMIVSANTTSSAMGDYCWISSVCWQMQWTGPVFNFCFVPFCRWVLTVLISTAFQAP